MRRCYSDYVDNIFQIFSRSQKSALGLRSLAVAAFGIAVIGVTLVWPALSFAAQPPTPPTTMQTSVAPLETVTSNTTSAAAPFGLINIGHLEDTQWNLQDKTNGYTRISVDIKPGYNTFPANQAYFYANNVWFNKYTGTNGGTAYAGLQTNGNNGTQAVGKMLIFSIWDATSAAAVPGGTAVQFGGEGTGWSVRVPYNWQAGTTYRVFMYRYKIVGASSVWSAYVTNLTTGVNQSIGMITVPTSFGTIYGPVTFHERYLGNPAPCNAVTPSKVDFFNMTANNTIKATAWNHYYVQPATGCADFLWLKETPTGYRSGVGMHR